MNRDHTFQADTIDVAGQWNCADMNDDIEYDTGTSPDNIVEDLYSRGFLYQLDASHCYSNYGNGTFSHLIILDSSAGNNTGVLFDVRASIDLTPNGPDPKIMKTFHCTMDGEGVMWVLENMESIQTLHAWCLGLQANVYDGTGTGAKNDSGSMLEQYLNSMVMVTGGKNYLLSTPPTTGDGGGDTQGCQRQRTSVPWEIIYSE